MSEQQFIYPERNEYDPDQVFRDSFGIYIGDSASVDVVLKLAPPWETYAKTHRWHPSQVVTTLSDGVTVAVHIRPTPEVKAWILGFGADAEVLMPAALREEVARDALKLASLYGSARGKRHGGSRHRVGRVRSRGASR